MSARRFHLPMRLGKQVSARLLYLQRKTFKKPISRQKSCPKTHRLETVHVPTRSVWPNKWKHKREAALTTSHNDLIDRQTYHTLPPTPILPVEVFPARMKPRFNSWASAATSFSVAQWLFPICSNCFATASCRASNSAAPCRRRLLRTTALSPSLKRSTMASSSTSTSKSSLTCSKKVRSDFRSRPRMDQSSFHASAASAETQVTTKSKNCFTPQWRTWRPTTLRSPAPTETLSSQLWGSTDSSAGLNSGCAAQACIKMDATDKKKQSPPAPASAA